jgi:hypothetical protein
LGAEALQEGSTGTTERSEIQDQYTNLIVN